MLKYYVLLHKILHNNPDLRKCLTRCRECGIFFLTDKRNAGRNDIRCPFGCRQTHLRKSSTKRSVDYYRSGWEGKYKKKLQNDKRKKNKSANLKIDTPKERKIILDETVFNYIRALVSMLERRKASLEEILTLIKRVLRQHSIAEKRKKYYFRNKRGP